MDGRSRFAHDLADVVALMEEAGSREEPNEDIAGFTILDHGLQCAALLQRDHPHDLELHVAGLLHDVGHLLTSDPEQHGTAAAAYLRPIVGPRVAVLVEGHVPAKRYLVAEDAGYLAELSTGSCRTLEVQGGAMTPEEARVFEATVHFEALVALRHADESAKDPAAIAPTLESWLPVLDSLTESVRRQRATHR